MRFGAALRQVLANPSLRGLQASWLLGIAAEKAYLVALLVFAYDIGGVLAVGLFDDARLAAIRGSSGPYSAPWPSRFPPLARCAWHPPRTSGVRRRGGSPSPPTSGCASSLRRPSSRESSPASTSPRPGPSCPALSRTPDELVASNAVTSLVEAVGSLVGPVVAGLILVVGGPALGLAVPTVAYLVAAARRPHDEIPSHRAQRGSRPPCVAGSWRSSVGSVPW